MIKVVIEVIIGVQPTQHVLGPIELPEFFAGARRSRLSSYSVFWISENPDLAIPVKDPTVLVPIFRFYNITVFATRIFTGDSAVPSVERILNPRNISRIWIFKDLSSLESPPYIFFVETSHRAVFIWVTVAQTNNDALAIIRRRGCW